MADENPKTKKKAAAIAKQLLAENPSVPAVEEPAPKQSGITDPGTTLG